MRLAVSFDLFPLVECELRLTLPLARAGTFTVWPGLFTSVGPLPSQETGWEAKSGTTLTFEVEESCASSLLLLFPSLLPFKD